MPFSLPHSENLTKDDQFALLVNQATVHLVSRYLEHAEFASKHGHADTLYTEQEFLDLIKRVQERMLSF